MEASELEAVVQVRDVDLTNGKGGAVFVVQVAGAGASWTDFARVTAPARCRRESVIRAAVDSPVEMTLRVLDERAAREFRVDLRARDPELVIV